MLSINQLLTLSRTYNVPLEDVLFIALNSNGVKFQCEFNRMRTALHLTNHSLFEYARHQNDMNYYFALPINQQSAFVIVHDTLLLGDVVIGKVSDATGDVCNSHYPRRNGTALNINPNSRTSCHGCEFCYTTYQVPCDRKKLKNETDLREFFGSWMNEYHLTDLSHLIQISVVTGCYDSGNDLCRFLHTLKKVAAEYHFNGKISYLGSQIATKEELDNLADLKPFCVCYSMETFERRDLLRDKKRALSVQNICDLMEHSIGANYETSFSYIVGLEPLAIMEKYFGYLWKHVNKFPIVNILQIHKYQKVGLLNPEAMNLEYYIKTRKLIESIFLGTSMRPLVWEDYRSLWYLRFGSEPLLGIRTP